MYKNVVKRVIDIFLSSIGIIVLIPVFLVIGIVIYADDPGPILFKQQRMGKDKKPFWMYKFRSMKVNTPQIPGYLMDDADSYITRAGHFLRKFSLDELPQIYNIFLGNMSIVGHRPSLYENEEKLVQERDKYSIHTVKPGLTGWAQVNGRDENTIQRKVRFDNEYAEKLNGGGLAAFSMDLKCFMITIAKVLRCSNIVEGSIEVDEEKEVVYK